MGSAFAQCSLAPVQAKCHRRWDVTLLAKGGPSPQSTAGYAAFHRACVALALLSAVSACRQITDRLGGTVSRCPSGLSPNGARCCAPGQRLNVGSCVGIPSSCPPGWHASFQGTRGCAFGFSTRFIEAGDYAVGPNDWESESVAAASGHVPAFWLDTVEVTWERYWGCVASGGCAKLGMDQGALEPGQPVTRIGVESAQAFCSWALGRLPRTAEWLRAAAGANSQRFPWGHTGLVCRRAAFGLVAGPCAEGGRAPELAGARPDGKNAQGVMDLVGNVAELVEVQPFSAPNPAGRPDGVPSEGVYDVRVRPALEVRGGSFRSDHAARLKSWSVEPYLGPRDDVGFRCAYDAEPSKPPSE